MRARGRDEAAGGGPGRRDRGPHWAGALLLLAGVASCVTLSSQDLQRTHRTAPIEGATERVGAEECELCHEDVHDYAPSPSYHADCESCHGPGEKHYDSEEPADIRFPANADCEECHDIGHSTLLGWNQSEHRRSDVFCTDCHAAHEREPWNLRRSDAVARAISPHAGDITRMCATCHADVAATFALPSHHPLQEGMLACIDCHDPHGERSLALGAPTALCTSCHQDYGGPWIYEHPPVTEDCGYCHAPHGASSRELLDTNEPGVCITCHTVAEAGAVHQPYAFSTRCSDCHSAVHGSYADPHLRR